MTCTYTRNGYLDPFESFRVEKQDAIHQPEGAGDQSKHLIPCDLEHKDTQGDIYETASHNLDLDHLASLFNQASQDVPSTSEATLTQNVTSLAWPRTNFCWDPASNDLWWTLFSPAEYDVAAGMTASFPTLMESESSESSFNPVQDAVCAGPDDVSCVMDEASSLSYDVEPPRLEPQQRSTLQQLPRVVVHQSSSSLPGGFTLLQLDPVEAKCSAIKQLLADTIPLTNAEDLDNYITRTNLLLCGRLFGLNFARNIPILHSPSFMLTEAPPLLLLAIFVAGACYSEDAIPAKCVTKFTMGLLISIERQTVWNPFFFLHQFRP